MTSNQTASKSLPVAGTVRAAIPVLLLLGFVTLIGVLQPSFMTVDTLVLVMADTATLFVLAAGITFVVMLGGIDPSIQAVASLSSVIVAVTLSRIGYWTFPATLLVGIVTGAFSGIVHVWLRIPSFIVTLATSGVVAAAALLLSQERSITIGETGRAYLTWITGRTLGIPSVILIGALVACVGIWLQRYTPFGRYSTAIGAGEAATLASGVKVNRQKVIAYSLSAGLAALAGILLTGRLSSGSPTLAKDR